MPWIFWNFGWFRFLCCIFLMFALFKFAGFFQGSWILWFLDFVSGRLVICKTWHQQLRNMHEILQTEHIVGLSGCCWRSQSEAPHIAPTSVSLHIWSGKCPSAQAMLVVTKSIESRFIIGSMYIADSFGSCNDLPQIQEIANASVDKSSNLYEHVSTIFAGDVGHFC